jgi:ABC-type lipoprotein release transport system permease subunit
MGVVKNVFRRKMRAFLTIFGITIGVLALVVMGAMAEKITLLVDGGIEYYGDKVIVTDASQGGSFSMAPVSTEKAAELEEVEGVKAAAPSLGMLLEEEAPAVSMGPPSMIVASDAKASQYESFKMTVAEGRDLHEDD